jgi:hypothetical protein
MQHTCKARNDVGNGATHGPGTHGDATETSDQPMHGACKQPREGGNTKQSSEHGVG